MYRYSEGPVDDEFEYVVEIYDAFDPPTERMLTSATNSRQEIYRDAATLLRYRDRLFSGDRDALEAL